MHCNREFLARGIVGRNSFLCYFFKPSSVETMGISNACNFEGLPIALLMGQNFKNERGMMPPQDSNRFLKSTIQQKAFAHIPLLVNQILFGVLPSRVQIADGFRSLIRNLLQDGDELSRA